MLINSILKQFEHFGVDLSLDRIRLLLADLGNPQEQVPVIHVAGTNGKGSVCAYLSAVLTEAGYRVGRYTSPHLVDWTERICLNEQPIAPEKLQQLLEQIQNTIRPDAPSPTQFEVITAAAWLYFAQQQVDVAVIEVGLGGRLDATNVCDRPLVTLITSISWEHWQRLGPTLAHIAAEKAGILKPGCPAIIGPLPPEAQTVIQQRITDLQIPGIFPPPAQLINPRHPGQTTKHNWASSQGIEYPLPLPGEAQLSNSALAIAALQLLRQQGWEISDSHIANGMAKTKWPGRLQWVNWRHGDISSPLLIDGAHNAAAAQVLRQYVDSSDSLDPMPCPSRQPVTWIIGMLSTKDHTGIFKALLRPGDYLYLVPVPDHSSADPQELLILAKNICPELADISCYPDLATALKNAITPLDRLKVLCGSLYLIGHFFGTHIID